MSLDKQDPQNKKEPFLQLNLPNVEGEEGSQNPVVVAIATAFFVLCALGSGLMLLGGPSPDSAFRIFRSALTFYPMMLLCLAGFGLFAWLGVKRLRYLLAKRSD